MIDRYEIVILHYSEIYLKSPYVKKQFENALQTRITYKLKVLGILKTTVQWRYNSIWIYGSFSREAMQYLSDTFGISYSIPALLCKSTIPSIRESINKLSDTLLSLQPKTYRVIAKKDKRILLSHYSVEYEVASFFPDWKVDLKHPEFVIYLDLKTNACSIFFEKIQGPGGLPYGTQGKVICLVSKGIDSPVAAYLMAKRGCELVLLHFGSEPLLKIKERLEYYAGKAIPILQIEYLSFLKNIKQNGSDKYQCILCKIGMYRIAEFVAEHKNAHAIITGENLGQVASQTLMNLSVLDTNASLPVLRPIIAFDKNETTKLNLQTGFSNLYQNPDCPFVPESPSTSCTVSKIESIKKVVGFDQLIEDFIMQMTIHETV